LSQKYWTTHPSENARRGTAILVKANIIYFELEEIRYKYLRAAVISAKLRSYNLTIAACYCPTEVQYTNVFRKLDPKFIAGRDFNGKHTAWGSRLITPGKGQELLNAINSFSCSYHSLLTPTYWPTDN
jgi:hypothetical protein